jgi:hypothetical protein
MPLEAPLPIHNNQKEKPRSSQQQPAADFETTNNATVYCQQHCQMFFSYSSSSSTPYSFPPQHNSPESLLRRDTKKTSSKKIKTLTLPAVTTKTSQTTPKDLTAFCDSLRKPHTQTFICTTLTLLLTYYTKNVMRKKLFSETDLENDG